MKTRRTNFALILASASAARADMLRTLGVKFRQVPPVNVNEPAIKGHCSFRVFLRHIAALAAEKAAAVGAKHPQFFILSADTAVWAAGRMFGKPASTAEAKRILRALSGRTHIISTALCLLSAADTAGRRVTFRGTASARVAIRPLTSAAINAYIEAVRPFGCAGAYALQQGGPAVIEKITGDPSTIVGLPAGILFRLLKKAKFPEKQGKTKP